VTSKTHGYHLLRFVVLVEAISICSATILSLMLILVFLSKSDVPDAQTSERSACVHHEKGHRSRSARGTFVLLRPFAFIHLPRLACGFSMLVCLTFANVSFAWKFVSRGDLALHANLLLRTLFPQKGVAHVFRCAFGPFRMVLTILLVLACIVGGLMALQSKLLSLYFVGTVPLDEWGSNSILLFLGFVNQLVWIFDYDFIEWNRILLLKFGGKDAVWDSHEMASVPQYFGMVFSRLVEGRIRHQPFSGLRALAAFLNFDSDCLQALLLSDKRKHCLGHVRNARLQIFEAVWDQNLLGKDRKERLHAIQEYMQEQKRALDKEFADYNPERSIAKGNMDLDMEILMLAERTRLLSQVQAHMADLCDEACDNSELGEDEAEESKSSTTDDDSTFRATDP